MNFSDILITFQWWLTLFILGIGFLPLSFFFFNNFFDKGYIFAKMFGIAVTSYLIFTVSLFHILPFSRTGSTILFLIVSAVLFFLLRNKKNIPALLKNYWKFFFFEEMLFGIALFFWTTIHSFAPDIHGLEKYMDFGFINSILRTDYFPPKDMWFTPLPINYYYFGHLMTAVLTKASGIASSFTFNLMLSTIFAFCLVESFSIGGNLYNFFVKNEKFLVLKRGIAGLLSACLVTFAGNLHILYAFFQAYPNDSPVPLWQLPLLPFSFPNGYWYPNATRFIYHTIHEFPIYSWTVADLHGHVLDIPVVLLTIAILLAFFINATIKYRNLKDPRIKSKHIQNKNVQKAKHFDFVHLTLLRISNLEFRYLLAISFLLAVMYMTNAWDGGIYLLLTSFIIYYLYSQKGIDYKKNFMSLIIVLLGFFILITPYNSNFKPFVSGIGILCSPDFLTNQTKIGPFLFEPDHCQHSPWWQLLTLYGFFYYFIVSFVIFIMKIKKYFTVDYFVLLLMILSTILITLPEFIYVKDIYPAHYRANTMFKLVFQAFMLLSLTSGYIMVRLISEIKNQKSKIFNFYSLFFLISFFLFSMVMLYPYQAINSYYGNLQTPHGLNGTEYLKTLHPGDYAAITWFNTNVKGQPVILEAQGDSYTDFARISANTGLPTILGWTVHEWLWRGTYAIPAPRIDEVKTMYSTTDTQKTNKLLQKYAVKYVIVGLMEYQQYPQLDEEKFKKLGKLVFQNQDTKIYQITSL